MMRVQEKHAAVPQVDVESVVTLLQAQTTKMLARGQHLQHFFCRDEVGAAGEVEVLTA